MNIFVTGGSGFVGTYLCKDLLDRGHRVTAVGSRPVHGRISHDHFRYISADTTEPGDWQEALADIDAAVNLAGKSIFRRWTDRYKQELYDSRILTTRHLVDALAADRPATLVSTSAVGYYGNRGDEILTETSEPGDDFLARLSRDWETEALRAEEKQVRIATARFGIVLGWGGGAIDKMVPAFKLMLGGPLGDGSQWFPWIHMDDLLAALRFALETPEFSGPANFTAPNPVRNKELAQALGDILHRPALMPAPAFMIRAVLGEFGKTLLSSTRAVPRKLLDAGFTFQYPTIREALEDLV
ncbi:MAG: TIGR01777 family oxidoreductase [Desulfobacterales bacterium]|nr:TIGR01777 family oxidoreductase [Desulfobacterales bacterium]